MFGAVLFAFLFYITVKGDLAKWLGLLGLAGTPPTTTATNTTQQALQSLGTITVTPNGLPQGALT